MNVERTAISGILALSFFKKRKIIFPAAFPVHQFQNPVFRMLERNVDVFEYFSLPGDLLYQFRAPITSG